MDNSILAELKFDPARGAFLYNDVRYLLIRPETLIAFQKAAEERLGTQADELLYAGGFTGGTLSGKKYREVFGLTEEQPERNNEWVQVDGDRSAGPQPRESGTWFGGPLDLSGIARGASYSAKLLVQYTSSCAV